MNNQRKFICLSLIGVFLLCLLLGGCAQKKAIVNPNGYIVTDMAQREVAISCKPKRIDTLSFYLDCMVLGLRDSRDLAAISYLADDKNSSNIVKIGSSIQEKIQNPSSERLIGLRPDIIFADNTIDKALLQTLTDSGLVVVVLKKPETIADIQNNIKLMAKSLQEEERGRYLIAAMDKKLQELQYKLGSIAQKEQKTVIVYSLAPTFGGAGGFFDNLCQAASARNGMAIAGIKSGQMLSKERLVQVNPDIIILPVFSDHGKVNLEPQINEFLTDQALSNVKAIRARAFYHPTEGYIYNRSQDAVFGAQDMAHALYGNLVEKPMNAHLTAYKIN